MTTKMTVGWLWFDNDSGRTLEEKVKLAAKRYKEKFGCKPNTCYVKALDNGDLQVDGVAVRAANHILPHHFWLGIGEKADG
jgi:hypothetical protein